MGSARATWSIVAVDARTREVGVAVASCIGGVEQTVAVVPSRGAVVAQALANLRARDALAGLLAEGVKPGEALERVTHEAFDPGGFTSGARMRQYGVVAMGYEDEPANFTGSWTVGWAGARQALGVSVQGNMLRGPEVVDDALAAYQARAESCLAERLLAALEAGAAAGGDRRCVPELSALSAALVVARPADPPASPTLYLLAPYEGELDTSGWRLLRQLIVPERGDAKDNPVRRLREAYARSAAGRCGGATSP